MIWVEHEITTDYKKAQAFPSKMAAEAAKRGFQNLYDSKITRGEGNSVLHDFEISKLGDFYIVSVEKWEWKMVPFIKQDRNIDYYTPTGTTPEKTFLGFLK